ncbi:hypothetical protein GCM10010524_33600 [Streptomyces mexicanus]
MTRRARDAFAFPLIAAEVAGALTPQEPQDHRAHLPHHDKPPLRDASQTGRQGLLLITDG